MLEQKKKKKKTRSISLCLKLKTAPDFWCTMLEQKERKKDCNKTEEVHNARKKKSASDF